MRDDRLNYDGLKQLVTALVQPSGVTFCLQQFQYSFAMNFLKSSNNIAELKQLMGLTNIK